MARIIDVIEWPDQGSTDIMQRVPEQGAGDIRIGSQVIARGSQVAVFFRDGKALDVFREGRYTLSTMNIPILASIINLGTNNKTPFPAEVYFVTTKDFIGQKWGTPNEITVPDSMMGVVQLRAHGTYSMAIRSALVRKSGAVAMSSSPRILHSRWYCPSFPVARISQPSLQSNTA